MDIKHEEVHNITVLVGGVTAPHFCRATVRQMDWKAVQQKMPQV